MSECINPNLQGSGQEEVTPPKIPINALFNSYDLARYGRVTDFAIGEIFKKYTTQKGWTVADLKDPANMKALYKGVKGYIFNILASKAGESTSQWDNLSDKAVADLDKIYENFDDWAAHHAAYNNIATVKNFSLEEEQPTDDEIGSDNIEDGDDVDEDEMDSADVRGRDFDNIGNEQSQIDLAAGDTKMIFRLLAKKEFNPSTGRSELVLDRDGLPTIVNTQAIWNLLAEHVAGIKDFARFKEAMQSQELKFRVPEIDDINEILRLDKEGAPTATETKQLIQFYQSFSKPKVPIKSALTGKENSYSLVDEILGNKRKIEDIANSQFVSGKIPVAYKNIVARSQAGVWYMKGVKLPELGESFEDRLKFLNFLGFTFSGRQFFSPEDEDDFRTMVLETSEPLHAGLQARLNDPDFEVTQPIRQLKQKYGNLPSEVQSINRLVNWESRWSRIVPTHSSRTASGELQQLIMNDSALSMATYHLNSSRTIEELMSTPSFINAKYNPQFRNSYIINYLFDADGNRIPGRSIVLELLSGAKKPGADGRNVNKLERDLSMKEKFIQDYKNFLLYGKTDVMRTETSHSFYMLGLYDGNNTKQYVKPSAFDNGWFAFKPFRDQILNYLNGEIARIKSYPQKKADNPSIPDTYGDFAIFGEVFGEGKNADLKARLLDPNEGPAKYDDFFKAYGQVLDNELNNVFKPMLNKLGVKEEDLKTKKLDEINVKPDGLHRAFIAGTLMQNIEFSILYSGDTLFFKDMHKRLKGLSSTGSVAADLPILHDYYTSQEGLLFHDKYSLAGANNLKWRAQNQKNFRTQVLTEYGIRKNNGYLHDVDLAKNIQRSLQLRDGADFSQKDADQIIDTIKKNAPGQKPADGEGYANLDFHRELSFRFGFSTAETEIAYKYEGLMYRKYIKPGYKTTAAEEEELKELEHMIYSDPTKYSLPILKVTYWGNVENSTVDAKAYDKFSIAPILPSDARNHPELKELMEDMVKGKYGYVKYQSATKLFTRGHHANLKSAEADLYSTPLLKEQIKTKNTQKVETSIPTQMLKLIFANLFDQGVAKTSRAQELYDEYTKSLKDIQKEQVNKVLTDLGFTFNIENGKPVIKGIDMTMLSKKLLREARRQQMNSNVLASLEINPATGQFEIPTEATGFHDQIGKLVSGIMDKGLRRFKFPGGDFVLETNANRSPLPWYKFSENGTTPIGARITLTQEYMKLLNKIHPDGDKIGTIDRLNTLLKSKKWREENKKSITIVLDRVPTDGPHSMDVAEIYEFLPPTKGSVIILPDEITLKSGTDFDYDKEKIITPSFDEDGNYLSTENDDIEKQILKKMQDLHDIMPELRRLADEDLEEDEYSTVINRIFGTSARRELFLANREWNGLLKRLWEIKQGISPMRNNQLIEKYAQVLALPEMYAELISPNSAAKVLGVADNIGKNMGNSATLPTGPRTLYYSENLKVYKTYFDAKNMLAMFAKDNTMQQLSTYLGINMNNTYRQLRFGTTWENTRINHLLLSPEEQERLIDNGKILASSREDLDGFIKQWWNSESINATVDAAKDPRFALLGISFYNVGVVNLMKHMGYPFERVMNFINNPALRQYFSYLESGMERNDALTKLAKERFLMKTKSSTKKPMSKKEAKEFMFFSDGELRQQSRLGSDENVKSVDGVREIGPDPNGGEKWLVTIEKTSYPNGWLVQDIMAAIDAGVPFGEKSNFNYMNDRINNNPIDNDRLVYLANPANSRFGAMKSDPSKAKERLAIYSDEIRIVANFLAMEKASWAFGDFRKFFNQDTNKLTNSLDVRLKSDLRDKMINTRMFSTEDIKKMEDQSILSAFMNSAVVARTYSSLFPILGSLPVQRTMTMLYQEYSKNWNARNKRGLRNMPKVLADDLLSSIIFTYGQVEGKNLFDVGKDLLIRNGAKPTMGDRLVKFRQQPFYAQIARDFPILDRFILDTHFVADAFDLNGLDEAFVIENIKFVKSPTETLLEQEEVIEQLRDLYYNYQYTGENAENVNKALKRFMTDLFITGLTQAGVGRNGMSFSEYIPLAFKKAIFSDAISQFQQLDKAAMVKYMSQFYWSFKNNNPKYFPSWKIAIEGVKKKQKVVNRNTYSDRFKYYKMNRQNIIAQDLTKEQAEKRADDLMGFIQKGVGGEKMGYMNQYNELIDKYKLERPKIDLSIPILDTTPISQNDATEENEFNPGPPQKQVTLKPDLDRDLKIAEDRSFFERLDDDSAAQFVDFDKNPEAKAAYDRMKDGTFLNKADEDAYNNSLELVNSSTWNRVMELYDKYGSSTLNIHQDMETPSDIRTQFGTFTLESGIEYNNIQDLYNQWVKEQLPEEDKEQAEIMLKKYGLGRYLYNYNPNQLSLFAEDEGYDGGPSDTSQDVELQSGQKVRINCQG